MTNFDHTSVLKYEAVNSLCLGTGDIAFDCTAGGGGHTELILQQVSPNGLTVAIDRDDIALAHLKARFNCELQNKNLVLTKSTFSNILAVAEENSLVNKAKGILADIGVSSPQLDDPSRGFSFLYNGPLDMRMDKSATSTSAETVVNTYSETDLSNIFYKYGEERNSRRIAYAIVKERENEIINTTSRLAEIVEKVNKKKGKKHPATKVFQAIRIYVNNELEELESLLAGSLKVLKPGGRLAIITFHSLEDRIVKTFFKEKSSLKLSEIEKSLPLTEAQRMQLSQKVLGKIIKPFPIIPEELEVKNNPRSRSAKLRVFEKAQTEHEENL